jgi:outer membrane receptor protein involved in Fe transport
MAHSIIELSCPFYEVIERIFMKPNLKHLPLIGLLFTTPALAADTDKSLDLSLDDVIVSADFRPTKASETPVSVTEINQETISSRGAQHVEEVLNLAPNVNISSGASRGQFIQIRGMGERSQFNNVINPSVGLVIDGVDFTRTGGAATLFDIESVEILRGPQGTKFGTNGLAGTVNLRSKAPTKDFDLHMETGLAEYNTRNLGVAVGGTLIDDRLLGRASIYSHQSDGYMDNDFLGRDNTQNQDELTLRGKLKFLVSDDFTVDLSYMHLNIDNGYDAFTLDNSRNSVSDQPGEDKLRTNAFAVKTNWNASDAVIIQSELTYMKSDITYSYDADWGFDGQFDPSLFPYVGFEQYDRNRENYSVELRMLSDKAGRIFGDTTDWTVGVYHFNQDEKFDQNSDFGAFGTVLLNGNYDTQNTAVYGQLDTHITDKLTLVSGLRVGYFEADYKDSDNIKAKPDEVLWGGKLGLNYQVTPDHLLFTSLSRGYKSGGVNNDGSLTNNQREFDAEYNINFEMGAKSKWLDGRLMTNVTAFYTDRRDAQVKSSTAVGVQFIDFISNAVSATHQGVEASMDWFLTDRFRLIGSLGLLDAEFDEYNLGGVSQNGKDVAHAPNYTFNLGTEVYVNDAWTVRANVEGKDSFYFSDSHNARSNGYAIVNASADYKFDHWKISVWARNLFDKDYYTRGFYFGNNPANGYADERYVQYAEPRVAGVTVSYDY